MSYCSKQAQAKDKTLCCGFRPFKEIAGELSIGQKLSLNKITFELPSIEVEYRKKYPGAYLHHLYIQGGLHATQEMVTSNLRMLNEDVDNDLKKSMLKRWQELSLEVFDFACQADAGKVFKEKKYTPYNSKAPQQSRNTPLAEPIVLVNGRSIVDIGFVDFGITFDSAGSIQFDMDPFCVAKSLVMHTMIKSKEVSAWYIVEVWLSSLWSKATFSAFKRATRDTLDQDGDIDINDEVKVIIEYWNRQKKMSSKAALQF